MKAHEHLFNLIENVNPSDWQTLDEIDGRFWCYIHQKAFKSAKRSEKLNCLILHLETPDEGTDEKVVTLREFFSISRDALKLHRPEGWRLEYINLENDHNYVAWFYNKKYNIGISSISCKTEELAEMYAIVQAIAYERGEL